MFNSKRKYVTLNKMHSSRREDLKYGKQNKNYQTKTQAVQSAFGQYQNQAYNIRMYHDAYCGGAAVKRKLFLA